MADVMISSNEARTRWSEVMECAHWREPVHITLSRKPYVVLVSEDWFRQAKAALEQKPE